MEGYILRFVDGLPIGEFWLAKPPGKTTIKTLPLPIFDSKEEAIEAYHNSLKMSRTFALTIPGGDAVSIVERPFEVIQITYTFQVVTTLSPQTTSNSDTL